MQSNVPKYSHRTLSLLSLLVLRLSTSISRKNLGALVLLLPRAIAGKLAPIPSPQNVLVRVIKCLIVNLPNLNFAKFLFSGVLLQFTKCLICQIYLLYRMQLTWTNDFDYTCAHSMNPSDIWPTCTTTAQVKCLHLPTISEKIHVAYIMQVTQYPGSLIMWGQKREPGQAFIYKLF